MDIESLMSGIAVVIDDKLEEEEDKISQIVQEIEEQWGIPFYKTYKIPSGSISDSLLKSASFVLLDWKLWEDGSSELEKDGIQNNIKFLEKVKGYFVPVFIFTNEALSDVVDELPGSLYNQDKLENNFIFIKGKEELMKEGVSVPIANWVEKNASVYALKTWEREFYESKRKLFSSMYAKSPDWPRVFWKSYEDDGVDPSSSITNLINNNLSGRFKMDIFEEQFLGSGSSDVSKEDLKLLMQAASFVMEENLAEDEIRSGDLFKMPQGRYLINIRPDCDCVPRDNEELGDVEIYCIRGKKMKEREILNSYEKGHFIERVSESISFSLYEGKTVKFSFKQLEKKKFSEIKNQRVGRLIHPYITRIQQRYASYLQRQGLPRIPKEAICE